MCKIIELSFKYPEYIFHMFAPGPYVILILISETQFENAAHFIYSMTSH